MTDFPHYTVQTPPQNLKARYDGADTALGWNRCHDVRDRAAEARAESISRQTAKNVYVRA
jgi:hypothetical protein